MKKSISIILSAVMLLGIITSASLPAFAAEIRWGDYWCSNTYYSNDGKDLTVNDSKEGNWNDDGKIIHPTVRAECPFEAPEGKRFKCWANKPEAATSYLFPTTYPDDGSIIGYGSFWEASDNERTYFEYGNFYAFWEDIDNPVRIVEIVGGEQYRPDYPPIICNKYGTITEPTDIDNKYEVIVGWYTNRKETEVGYDPEDPAVRIYEYEYDEKDRYDFSSPVINDFTLYARTILKEDAAVVNFYNASDTSKIITTTATVKGTACACPDELKGMKWYTDEECTKEFDFNTPLTNNINLYRKTANPDEDPTEDKPTEPETTTAVPDETSETTAPAETTKPAEDKPTEPAETTKPAEDKPTAPVSGTQIVNYFPEKELLEKGKAIKLVVQDTDGNITNYDMTPTVMMYDGVPVYTVKIPADLDIYMAQFQYYNGETWQGQFNVSGPQLEKAKGKIITSDGSVYGESKSAEPTKSTASKKKANPIKVSVKTKSVKLKKLKKKNQTVKAITIKSAQGKVSCKIIKAAKIKKFLKINAKGIITFNKWKKAKKGTYSLKVSITAKGNKDYKPKTITKLIKIKVK